MISFQLMVHWEEHGDGEPRLHIALERNLGERLPARAQEKVLASRGLALLANVLAAGMDDEEAGLPDGTIHAQVGHISAQVMKRYSRICRQELNRAAAALEPMFFKNVLLIMPGDSDGATVN
ncbi:MAG: hypothetical protein LAP85_20830 [Acidobacteriia bacterium]|nr:hypothetical protein [Terriglobia bacterium]